MRYWLSYDLGLRGHYNELYEWLDNVNAKECGESVATFLSDMSPQEIEDELEEILNTGARIYLVWKPEIGSIKGKFILGKRKKKPPWFGYAEVEEDVEDLME
ncbi:MAG: hypothetical protein P9X24_12250 [Candidatus Hatepunaea meridiana]|nr:hypothetical protein [Candidatus Hatepunaea meridiana]